MCWQLEMLLNETWKQKIDVIMSSIELEPELDAPIAGMSLTHELGARPWQTPPEMPTVEDAIKTFI